MPNKESDRDLHALVRRYQLHKCSDYCRRKRKQGKTFVTHCKTGFPRQPCNSAAVHNVNEKVKTYQKIY